MDLPDEILSPEQDTSLVANSTASDPTNTSLMHLQLREHSEAPLSAFHLTGTVKDPSGVQRSTLLAQQSSSTTAAVSTTTGTVNTATLQPAQMTSISVPTAVLNLHSTACKSSTTASATFSGLAPLQGPQPAPPIERLSRPMAFDKMESLVREMQDSDNGVPVRSQKLFLTSIPSAFMGYDLIEWLMERLSTEESEALNISNQLCQHGYFFPVSDSKTLMVKDDSSLYRFQTPYYWPWQQKAPDQIEYAIYLAKRSLRNKQRHGLEDYETEALASLHKNLKGKWDFILMQAEEQVRLAKDRKKGDKIVGDSQERAYWRVHRPPPGQFTPLEPCPIPSRDRQGKPRKRTVDDWQREVDILKASLGRNRVKMSQACESLVAYYETFSEYDPMMQPPLPSNPWVSEDVSFWQLNNPVVDVPTEKRVKRWGISIEEVVSDPTGLQEFTQYLKKEYSHENIRFWMAVNDLRRSSHSQISHKVKEIYEEFLEPGAPCEINIDGKTMEKVQQGLKNPSRFAFDAAAEHIYALLLKKDCYPRFVRSEHYKSLMVNAIQPSLKKRFFGFGGGAKKKGSTSTAPNPSMLTQPSIGPVGSGNINSLSKRRGSDRSLTGSAHELAISGVKDCSKVPHSHSQSNLSDIPYREMNRNVVSTLEVTMEGSVSNSCAVCPWDTATLDKPASESSVTVSVLPWENTDPKPTAKPSNATNLKRGNDVPHTITEITEVSERMKRSCGLRQNTLDGDFHSTKRLVPVVTEQRRASMTMAPRLSDLQFCLLANSSGNSGTLSDSNGCLNLQKQQSMTERQKHLQQQSSDCASQGSLSISFEEKEQGESIFDNLEASTVPTVPEETPVSVRSTHATETTISTHDRSQQRCDRKAEDPDAVSRYQVQEGNREESEADTITLTQTQTRQRQQPAVDAAYTTTLPASAIVISTDASIAIAPKDHSTIYDATVPGLGQDTCHTINTVCTAGGNTAEVMDAMKSSVHLVNVDTEPKSKTVTPRISIICSNLSEEVEESVQEKERDLHRKQLSECTPVQDSNELVAADQICCVERSQQHPIGIGTATSVATQTVDVLSEDAGDDISPLIEVEHSFFADTLRQQAHNCGEFEQTEYDIFMGSTDGLMPGCVAPAPTPAPSIAPLAEVEMDPPDDEVAVGDLEQLCQSSVPSGDGLASGTSGTSAVVIIDEPIKRRKHKERKERPSELDSIQAQKSEEDCNERKGNAVCPWDDETELAADDAPYVKTYSTLGYL